MSSLSRKQRRAKEAKLKKSGSPASLPPQVKQALENALQLHKSGNLVQAEEIYMKIVQAFPENHEALHLLGVINYQKGNFSQAVALIGKAVEIYTKAPAYYNNLGNAFVGAGGLESAVDAYKRALVLKPDYPEAINNIGAVLHELGDFEKEIKYYKKGLGYASGNGALLNELTKAMKDSCLWDGLDEYISQLVGATKDSIAGGVKAALTPYHSLTLDIDPGFKKQIAVAYAKKSFVNLQPSFEHNRQANDKIKIGYVSADYRDHPTAHLINGLFKLHNRDKFEVYAYSLGKDDGSEYRKSIEQNSDHFVDFLNYPVGDIADRIYSDKIDILVDVMGYIQNAIPELFALRPAPLNISYLAYPGTMGAEFIDYLVTDHVAVLPKHEDCYSEKLIFMPDTYFITDNEQKIAQAPSREQCGLPEDKFVFCSFNKSNKIDAKVFNCWMDILTQVPDSVLWLLSDNEFTKGNLCFEVEQRGVSPERLVFAGRLPKGQHLARHKNADLFLDCFTVNAHTTAIDSLWAGLPVVTMAGGDIISRASASILTAAGLPELITSNVEDYKGLILKYPSDKKLLDSVKKKLSTNIKKEPLFDTKGYVKNLENAFEEIISKQGEG